MSRQLEKLIRSQTDQRVKILATNTYRFEPDPLIDDQPADAQLRWKRLLVNAALRMPDHNYPYRRIDKERYLIAMLRFVAPLDMGKSGPFQLPKVIDILDSRPEVIRGLLYGDLSMRTKALKQIPRSQDLFPTIKLDDAQAQEFKKIIARLIGNEFGIEEGISNADDSILYRRSDHGVKKLVQHVLDKTRNPGWLVRQDFLQGLFEKDHTSSLIKIRDELTQLIDQFEARHDDFGVWEADMKLRQFARRQHQMDRDFRQVKAIMVVFLFVFSGYFGLFISQADNPLLLIGLGFFIFMPVTIMALVANYTHLRFAISHVEQTRLDISDLNTRLAGDAD